MFPFGKKAGEGSKRGGPSTGGSTAASRESILEAARKERESRAVYRDTAVYAVKIQRIVRGYLARAKLLKEQVANINGKLSDLSKLSAVLAARGMKFTPPLSSVYALLSSLLLCKGAIRERICKLSAADAAAIAGVFALCIQNGKGDSGCLTAGVFSSPTVSFPLSGKGWKDFSTSLQRICTWKTTILRSIQLASACLLHVEMPASAMLVCAEWIETGMHAFGSISTTIHTFLWENSFVSQTVRPFLLHITPDPHAARVRATDEELLLGSKLVDLGVENITASAAHSDECNVVSASLLSVPFLLAKAPKQQVLTSGIDIIRFAILGFEAFRRRSGGDWHFGMVSFLRKITTRSAKSKHLSKLQHYGYASSVDRLLSSWSLDVFFIGNLVQLLSWRHFNEASAAASSSTSILASQLDAQLATTCLNFVADVLYPFTEELTSATNPVVWLANGTRCSAGSAGAELVAMPPLMVTQLRCLSHESMAKALASVCSKMNAQQLKHERLMKPDDFDEERATYDAYAIDVAAIGSEDSHLSAAPSLGYAVMQSIWETSKLALSLFKRKRAEPPRPAAAVTMESPTIRQVAKSPATSGTAFNAPAFFAFCRLYSMMLAPTNRSLSAIAASTKSEVEPIIGRRYLLNALAYTPSLRLVYKLWYFLVETVDIRNFLDNSAYKSTVVPQGGFAVLTLFVLLFNHLIPVVDDYELHQQNTPLPLRELRHAVRLLRDIIAHAEGIGVDKYVGDAVEKMKAPASPFWPRFVSVTASLLRAIYDRHSQRPLGPQDMWLVNLTKVSLLILPSVGSDDAHEATRRLLGVMPFSVPFETRAAIYQDIRDEDRRLHQEGMPQVRITVFRTRLFESAAAALEKIHGESLKRKVYVTFVNAEGIEESGVDAGGLFKELWTSIAAVVFNPSYGLFKVTDQGELYPNPDSALCTAEGDETQFELMGRILGKALYEGITIGPQFARFFLQKLLGRAVNLHHLSSLDPELYKSLMFLKTYDGDVSDLSLTFTVSTEFGAAGDEKELIPGGASIPVTEKNRMQYIYLIADWRLNKSIERQCAAFLRGLREIMPLSWLNTFSAPELQVVISGAAKGIDVADLERYTKYGPGYHAVHSTISMFWKVMAELPPKDRAAVLKFVTSCERPPPNGFRDLNPPFTIHKLPSGSPGTLLPMASTCFNVLKLPDYPDKATMKSKLLAAVHSGAGFEIT